MVKRKLEDKDILSLPDLYTSGLSTWEIAKKFDTCHSNILYHLKKLKVKRRDRSSAAKEGVKANRIIIKKNKIPKNLELNENLSYILGVLCGDGCLYYNDQRRAYTLGLSATDKEFVDKFRKAIFNFFKIKPTNEFKKSKIQNWNDQYATRLCSKEACDFVNSFGKFGKAEWKVLGVIRNADSKIKCAFIRGFFDSEGEIDKQNGRVGAASMNLEGLKDIQELLNSIDIRSTIIKKKDIRPNTHQKYVLRIQDKNSITLFYSLIGFTIQRKQDILEAFLSKWNIKEEIILPRDRERLTP